MLKLPYRIELLLRLGQYMGGNSAEWTAAKVQAEAENPWFVQQFIHEAVQNICKNFLTAEKLAAWVAAYELPQQNTAPKVVGLVTAGNIPLVGFHDFLCVFICGHHLRIKPSAKDSALLKHLAQQLICWEPALAQSIQFAEQLKGCHAYIATGSNNTGRYFEYYFRNHPHIIRRNRTSVAVLTGHESREQLDLLAGDLLLYFGQGCRNVSKLYVPLGYDFEPLVRSFDAYSWMADHQKFKNNYDYNLAIMLLNGQYYMTNGVLLLSENDAMFSPLSVVNYSFYQVDPPLNLAQQHPQDIQAVVGAGGIDFGTAQQPQLANYADGVDTLSFLTSL
ncbi:MAG: acyl-CoA reductase [Bacteroidetes bacterium]|nr:MAG: acyl-CoA reductase [Bacteroidota bacterium]